MTSNCFDIGSIQAFLDGELAQEEAIRVSSHVAVCDACAAAIAAAEDESALVFSALDREFNTLVPTQRLWTKINDSIAVERESRPVWQKVWAYVRISLLDPSIAAAAAIILVIGIAGSVWFHRSAAEDPTLAVLPSNVPASTSRPATSSQTLPVVSSPAADEPAYVAERPVRRESFVVERASYRTEARRPVVETAAVRTSAADNSSAPGFMPGEESYVRTISTLNKTVGDQKEAVLRPSERISYERDMAVVNDTISKMRDAVKKNPRNESAKQLLYSSYQNKIDLLNSVAQKEELVSLR